MSTARLWILAHLLLASPAVALAEEAQYPAPGGFVSDFAGVLSPAASSALEGRLRELENKTTAEIAVYVVRSVAPETIESYAVKRFQTWRWPGASRDGIGKEGKDNGVLLVAAIDDRKVRIEVGYGLEGVIPDAVAKRIIETRVLPRFREKDYDRGIADGVEALAARITGEAALPSPTPEGEAGTSSGGVIVPLAVFFGIAGFIVAMIILARRSGRSGGSGGGWSSGSSSGGWSSGSSGSSSGGSSFGSSGGGRSGGGGASGSW